MKKTLLYFVCLLSIAGIGFGVARGYKKSRPSQVKIVKEEKPFVIIIPSFNNSAYCERNLFSVLTQKYNNYRVIYIDDHSQDDTYDIIAAMLKANPEGHRVQLIRNEKNKGALDNLYHAIHSCKDNEIIVTVDGDDFLAHEFVLTKLNKIYANQKVWMTYGNYLDYPSFVQKPLICEKIPKKIVQNRSYRKHKWMATHLRTFYAALFKKIKLNDLLYEGHFLPMAWDLAFMIPMLEMSGTHAVFVRDVLYLYNRKNPISDHIINFELQNKCSDHVRKLPCYPRVSL